MQTETDTPRDVWEFLEQERPQARHTADLFRWSLNYDHGRRPFDLFADMIGYSAEHLGTSLFAGDYAGTVGYLEADYLADALKEWATNPQAVEQWITDLFACEG